MKSQARSQEGDGDNSTRNKKRKRTRKSKTSTEPMNQWGCILDFDCSQLFHLVLKLVPSLTPSFAEICKQYNYRWNQTHESEFIVSATVILDYYCQWFYCRWSNKDRVFTGYIEDKSTWLNNTRRSAHEIISRKEMANGGGATRLDSEHLNRDMVFAPLRSIYMANSYSLDSLSILSRKWNSKVPSSKLHSPRS